MIHIYLTINFNKWYVTLIHLFLLIFPLIWSFSIDWSFQVNYIVPFISIINLFKWSCIRVKYRYTCITFVISDLDLYIFSLLISWWKTPILPVKFIIYLCDKRTEACFLLVKSWLILNDVGAIRLFFNEKLTQRGMLIDWKTYTTSSIRIEVFFYSDLEITVIKQVFQFFIRFKKKH